MDRKKRPIAVIDSGVGGISVLKELVSIMPRENYIYFGDSANAPYGTKSSEEVLHITRENLDTLKKIGIKALVIACNTATSVAADVLRKENPDMIIVGIEPSIKPPAIELDHPRVLVMATPLTLKEKKFLDLVKQYSDREEIIPLPCPGLVEIIESGRLDSDELDIYLEDLLGHYRNQNIDALVLGCTHYPHVKTAIKRHIDPCIKIFDGGPGTARQARRLIADRDLLNDCGTGKVDFINSSDDYSLIELSKYLLCRQ